MTRRQFFTQAAAAVSALSLASTAKSQSMPKWTHVIDRRPRVHEIEFTIGGFKPGDIRVGDKITVWHEKSVVNAEVKEITSLRLVSGDYLHLVTGRPLGYVRVDGSGWHAHSYSV